MKNVIRTLSAAVIAVGLTFGATACGGDPCAQLVDKVCKEVGQKQCDEMKKEMAEDKELTADQKKAACEMMLKDPKILEGLKEAAKAQSAAEEKK